MSVHITSAADTDHIHIQHAAGKGLDNDKYKQYFAFVNYDIFFLFSSSLSIMILVALLNSFKLLQIYILILIILLVILLLLLIILHLLLILLLLLLVILLLLLVILPRQAGQERLLFYLHLSPAPCLSPQSYVTLQYSVLQFLCHCTV